MDRELQIVSVRTRPEGFYGTNVTENSSRRRDLGAWIRNYNQHPAGEALEGCSDAVAAEHSSPTVGIRRPDTEPQ